MHVFNPKSTWHIHRYQLADSVEDMDAELAFRQYWSWTMGNETTESYYYMPTFNKDNTDDTADINSTLEGQKIGDVYEDAYSDYKDWEQIEV